MMRKQRTSGRRKKEKTIISAVFLLLLLLLLLALYFLLPPEIRETLSGKTDVRTDASEEMQNAVSAPPEKHTLKCTVLNVGQGSAAVFESGGRYLVVDTGSGSHAQNTVAYLKKQNAERIEILCLTHWDADHIGGCVGVLKNFSCDRILSAGYEGNTRTYRSFTEEITDQQKELTVPSPGDEFSFGDCTLRMNGPVRLYENENSNSLSMTVSDGINTVYIGGDATEESEKDMTAAGLIRHADVYICNHHGSSSSSCEAFISALSPSYAVISCDGENGGYGHPAKKVLNRLLNAGAAIYRTDSQGDIVFYFDGEGHVIFEKEPTDNFEPGVFTEREFPGAEAD